MKYYSVRIQVDFDTPRDMPPRITAGKPWRSVGYFQSFYCTEESKEKAKQLVLDFYEENETNPKSCKCRFERSAWMRGLMKREQLSIVSHDLTDEMFEKRNQTGIWYFGNQEHYVSEADYAASIMEDEDF
ncbi:MAG: hypothetical protein MUQ20_03095 [Deltaproteobacteria bacterium]|nr:hypothetical protein [Deltaproteobacteria bacterium]